MKNIVIIGGGTGGTLAANRLRRHFTEEDVIIEVIDRNDDHIYQPGLLFIPFGILEHEDIIRSRTAQFNEGIRVHIDTVHHIDPSEHRVVLGGGSSMHYDVCIIASGSVLLPQATEGLLGSGWMKDVFTFYEPEGATALTRALDSFDHGHIVIDIADIPIRCPVAPLEFTFLADWYFHEKGARNNVSITFVTPLSSAFTKPVCSASLGHLLEEKKVNLVSDFLCARVDEEQHVIVSYDGRKVPYDLAVVVPIHEGAPFVGRTKGLGDALNFVTVDPGTLQSTSFPDIFAIGDAAYIPASKAGSVAHFEGEILVRNIDCFLRGVAPDATFDGHVNCFVETGFGKALLIDFNYDHEPVPGHFPSALGLPLMKESRMNHVAKLLFQWFYWHGLLPGREIPGIPDAMPLAGKQLKGIAQKRVPTGTKK